MELHRLGTLLGLIATVGCGSEQNLPPGSAAADSAGIRIITSTGAPPQFHPTSVATIGTLTGDEMYTFNQIADVEIHPNGVLYVLDAGDKMVKVYDMSGRHLYSFGREGEGPEEFLSASNLIMWSDTVAVFDRRLQKISKFDVRNGDYLIAERMPYSSSYAGFPSAVERLPSGDFLIVGITGCRLPKTSDNSIWRVFLAQSELGITDTIANRLRGNSLPFYGEGDAFCGAPSFPFGASPMLAAGQGRVAVAAGERGEIWVYDQSSDLQNPDEIWRYEVPPTEVTEEDRIAYAGQFAEADPELREAFRKALEERGFPPEWPRVADLLFDNDGRVWAQRGGPEDSEHRIWDVLSAGGQHIAVVWFPSGIRLGAVCAEHAAGLRRDEMDVEYVELFQIPNLDGLSP